MRFDRADVVRDSHNSSNGGKIMANKKKIPLYESLREHEMMINKRLKINEIMKRKKKKKKISLYESLREFLVLIAGFMCIGVIFYPIVLWICWLCHFYSLWKFLLSPFKNCQNG